MKDDVIITSIIRTIIATLLVALFVGSFQGCKKLEFISKTNTTNTSIERERFDSAHTVAGDKATANLLIECDSVGNAHLVALNTEQGKRINLELQVQSLQSALDSAKAAAKSNPNLPIPSVANEPLIVSVDCKEDSFQVIIRGLHERIAIYEKKESELQEPVRYIPDFYRNCTIAFWVLLIANILIIALLIWRNWSKVAAWGINIRSKFRHF